MAITNSVSGPTVGNAGKADAFNAAFDAAVEEVLPEGTTFAKGAMEPDDPIEPVETSDSEDASLDSAPALDETAEEKAQRLRDEKGRFAKEAAATKADAKPAPVTPAMSPPAHWDVATRDAFGKLPAEAQKILLDRSKHLEAGFTRKSTELAEDKKFATTVRSLIRDDHRNQLRQVGMSETDGIAHLLKLNDYATQNPAGYVRWIMQQAKIDPRQAFPELSGGQQTGEAPVYDPQFQQLQATVQTLQQREAARERQQQETAAQEYQGRVASAGDVISKFRDATDDAGNLAHPYFEEVKDAVAQLCANHPTIKAIPDIAERLAQAYETAVYADPSKRKGVMDSELARAKAELTRKNDVEKARRAAPAVKASAPTTGLRGNKQSLESAVRGAMRSMVNGA